jgi:hypothetical protein
MIKLEVEYDLVVIIDCLPKKQQEKYQISSKLMSFLASKGIKQKTLNCNSKKAIIEAFKYLNTLAETNKFCLQIVSHGNNFGIGIAETKELITWKEFNSYLGLLNDKLSNTLILNMTSCKGLYGIKMNDEAKENYPFFGLIGCNRNLKVVEGKLANELFYTKLIEGKNISEIIPEIQGEFKKLGKPDNVIFSMSSEGYKKIKNHIERTKPNA